jgi:hypothetical protein
MQWSICGFDFNIIVHMQIGGVLGKIPSSRKSANLAVKKLDCFSMIFLTQLFLQ